MRIGIDIDEVLANTLNGVIAFHNERYGTCFKKEDFFSYDCDEVWGGTREETIRKWYAFFETDHFSSVDPIAGALPALQILKENGHELFAITARPLVIAPQTNAWINSYFPGIFSGIHFGNRAGYDGVKKRKSEMCAELGITVIVEDDLYHAVDCAECGIRVLLLDHPWNQRELPANVYRMFSWDDVFRMIS